jgi:hypothetical protein
MQREPEHLDADQGGGPYPDSAEGKQLSMTTARTLALLRHINQSLER